MAGGNSTITVCLKQCRNLHSPRADTFKCFARVELGPQSLGESGPVEYVGEPLPLDFHVSLQCSTNDPHSLDEIAQNPVLVSILEVLPKDKKAKEEKTSVLGQTTVDLLPLLQGETSLQLTARLHTPGGQEGAATGASGGDGETTSDVDIEVSVSQPLLTADEIAKSNLLTVRLRSLHSLPDSWQPHSSPYTFTFTFPLPPSSSTDTMPPGIAVPNGILKASPDKDPSARSTHWRWPNLPSAVGEVSTLPEGQIKQCALEDESGEIKSPQDVKFRRTAECDKPRVVWYVEHRSWLSPQATSTLLQHLSQCALWPCEVGRVGMVGGGGKGKGKEEEQVLSYHAVSYINLAPMLYPGATHICGAYRLRPYNETEVIEKTEREHPSILLASQALQQAAASASGKKTAVSKRTSSVARLQDSSTVQSEDGGMVEGGGEGKSEAHAFVEAMSYVYLEIELERALIPKRPASVLAERISEYIPPRPPLPRRVGGAERAVHDFHEQTAKITNILLEEYRDLFGEGLSRGELSETREAVDDRRSKLLFHLNSSGKYYAFKEQLKQAVVKIVRERYLNKINLKDKAQLQSFLSELYVFLTDQIHSGMKKVLSLEDPAPPSPSVVDCDLLKHFATEAEDCGDFTLAEKYYKERVARADHVPMHWYDYGVFCLLVGDLEQSEQCFKEAVSLDQKMVPALLLYGMVCCLVDRYSDGEQFFEMATTIDPDNVIAWTMRGLSYELIGNGVYQEMCFQEALKLNLGRTRKTFVTQGSKTTPTAAASQSKTTISSKQTGNLRQLSGSSVGEVPPVMVQSSHSLSSSSSQKIQEQEKSTRALTVTEEPQPMSGGSENDHRKTFTSITDSTVSFNERASVIRDEKGDTTSVQLKGGEGDTIQEPPLVQDGVAMTEPARSSPKLASFSAASVKSVGGHSLRQDSDHQAPPSGVFLQTATYLLDVHATKFAEMSLSHDLTTYPAAGPSPQYHVAEARLHLERKEYTEAEKSLREAITRDFQDSNAWSLLGHTHYLTGDYTSARDAYERTVNYVNPPAHLHAVYLRLADIYLRNQEYEKAKETFLRACRKSPSSVTWRGVGIACYKLGDLAQAEDAMCEANILSNQDPQVWAYLTLICLRTERTVEAEQALKFAGKCGLNDSSLIGEVQEQYKIHAPSEDISTYIPQTTILT